MYQYTIEYTDFNGNPHIETLYFHISKTSVLMAEDNVYKSIIEQGKALQAQAIGVEEAQKRIAEKRAATPSNGEFDTSQKIDFDGDEMIVANGIRSMARLLAKGLDMSYGIRSEDGTKFSRTPAILEDWKQSLSYEALIDKLLGNPDLMVTFIQNLMK